MLTEDEIAGIREDMEPTRQSLCTILRPARVSNGRGGWQDGYAPLAEDVPCSYGPEHETQSGSETVEASRIQATTFWRFHLPYGQDIGAADRITVDGRTFEVKAILDPRTISLETAVRCTEKV